MKEDEFEDVDCIRLVRQQFFACYPSCRRVIETKSGENRMFDPGGSQGRLRACPILGTWRALLWGEVMHAGTAGDDLQRFLKDR